MLSGKLLHILSLFTLIITTQNTCSGANAKTASTAWAFHDEWEGIIFMTFTSSKAHRIFLAYVLPNDLKQTFPYKIFHLAPMLRNASISDRLKSAWEGGFYLERPVGYLAMISEIV